MFDDGKGSVLIHALLPCRHCVLEQQCSCFSDLLEVENELQPKSSRFHFGSSFLSFFNGTYVGKNAPALRLMHSGYENDYFG